MADTAKRLAGPVAGTGSAATLYTVPASTTSILRNLHVANTSTTRQTFRMSIGADAAGTRLYSDTPVEAGSVIDWSGFQVLTAGETLKWSAPSSLTITVSGVEAT